MENPDIAQQEIKNNRPYECGHCGYETHADNEFCPMCGESMND